MNNGWFYFFDCRGCIVKLYVFLDILYGLLIVVWLNIFSRKMFGGLEINFKGNVMKNKDILILGLYVVGEVFGFGGGGVYGYNFLEGIFIGGCIFLGWVVGRVIVDIYIFEWLCFCFYCYCCWCYCLVMSFGWWVIDVCVLSKLGLCVIGMVYGVEIMIMFKLVCMKCFKVCESGKGE